MKWIGQHIWDYISRFRNDVYLEDISTGTIASGGNLGLDANNKIVKADTEAGELTIANATDNRVVTSLGGTDLNAEANMTFTGSVLTVNAGVNSFINSSGCAVTITDSGDNADGGILTLHGHRAGTDAQDDDECGRIVFSGYDDGTPSTQNYAIIKTSIADASSGAEEGKLQIQVASHDGEMVSGLTMFSGDAEDEVDINLGHGATSITTIAGDLSVTTGLILDSVDVTTIQTSAESFANNDTSLMTSAAIQDEVLATAPAVTLAGSLDYLTISGQEITRNAIDLAADVTGVLPSANLDADTAHLTTDQTFTGVKMINTRRFDITAGGSAGEYMGDVVYTGTTTSMTAGNLYFYSNAGTWLPANAGATGTSTGLLAISLGTISDTHGMLLRGMVTTSAIAGTPDEGAILYVRATDGVITTAVPGSGNVVRIVGYCMENSNNRIWFDPDKTWVEVA
jgi:hypothetical protein